jgi:hypothetical protein
LEVRCNDLERAQSFLQNLGLPVRLDADHILRITVDAERDAQINQQLVAAGFSPHHLSRPAVSLESLFFGLTQENTR